MLRNSIIAAAIAVVAPLSVSAATIDLGLGGTTWQINAYEPIGQSFTAEDALVDIEYWIVSFNTQFPLESITANLYDGEGLGGSVVDTVTVDPLGGFTGYFKFFDNIALTVGSVYTIALTSPNPYWGAQSADQSYDGGTGFLSGAPVSVDMAIRVTPDLSAVPLPAGGLLLLGGLGLLGAAKRRKRNAA